MSASRRTRAIAARVRATDVRWSVAVPTRICGASERNGGGGRLLWCDGPPGGPVALVRRFEQVAGEVTTRQRSRSIFLCACFPSATDRVPVACNHRMRLHVVPSYWPTMD